MNWKISVFVVTALAIAPGAASAQDGETHAGREQVVTNQIEEAPSPTTSDAPTAEPTSKILMYRTRTLLGAAVACPIRIKGTEVVELGRGKYFEMEVEPGRYILTNKTSSVEVNVEAGETRYVRCTMATGFLTARAKLEIVGPESFEPDRDKYERPGE